MLFWIKISHFAPLCCRPGIAYVRFTASLVISVSLANRWKMEEESEADAARRGRKCGFHSEMANHNSFRDIRASRWKDGSLAMQKQRETIAVRLLVGMRRIPLTPTAPFDKYVDRFSRCLNGCLLNAGTDVKFLQNNHIDERCGNWCTVTISPASLFCKFLTLYNCKVRTSA